MGELFIVCLLSVSTPVFDKGEVRFTESGSLVGRDLHHQMDRLIPRPVVEHKCAEMDLMSVLLVTDARYIGRECSIRRFPGTEVKEIRCGFREEMHL